MRLIDGDALKETIRTSLGIRSLSYLLPSECAIVRLIDKAPKVDAAPRSPAHWILSDFQNPEDVENNNFNYICSNCGCGDVHADGVEVDYCWHCGSRMIDEGDKND